LVLVLADRLKGNAVQIGNRPAAVSFAKGLFTVVPLIFIKNGKDKKPKQVRRPAQTT
jgi:hypothetical protein